MTNLGTQFSRRQIQIKTTKYTTADIFPLRTLYIQKMYTNRTEKQEVKTNVSHHWEQSGFKALTESVCNMCIKKSCVSVWWLNRSRHIFQYPLPPLFFYKMKITAFDGLIIQRGERSCFSSWYSSFITFESKPYLFLCRQHKINPCLSLDLSALCKV